MTNSVRIEPWGIRLSTPKTWGDVPERMYPQLVAALGLPSVQLRRLCITMVLMDVNLRRPKLWWVWWVHLGRDARHSLTQLADNFLTPAPDTTTIMHSLRAGLRRLHLCAPDLLNELDIYTWTVADSYFAQWCKSNDRQWLQAMASVLYVRPGTPRAARLQGVSLPLVRKVPVRQLQAVAANWSMMRKKVEMECPHLFATKEEGVAKKSTAWGDVLLSFSGGKFGPYSETCLAPARAFLRDANLRICDAKNAAHRAKQNRR